MKGERFSSSVWIKPSLQTIWFQDEEDERKTFFDDEGVIIFQEDWDKHDFCNWADKQKRKGRSTMWQYIPVVEFLVQGYKIRNILAWKSTYPMEMIEFWEFVYWCCVELSKIGIILVIKLFKTWYYQKCQVWKEKLQWYVHSVQIYSVSKFMIVIVVKMLVHGHH